MKLAQLSALTAALVVTSAVHANELLSKGSLDLNLQNYYLKASGNLHLNNINVPKADHSDSQWSQAVSVNFVSGYYANVIGFDLGAHYALKLRGFWRPHHRSTTR